MAQRRRRQLRRNALVFLGSLVAHSLFFYAVLNQFHFYPEPQVNEQAVEVEIVPPPPQPPVPPPLIIPHIKQTIAPTPQPPSPPPTPQPQPQPKPQPPKTPQQTTQRATPTPTATASAPAATAVKPSPTPTPKPTPAPTPSPLAPAPPAPQPGPPKSVSRSTLLPSQANTAVQSPKIVLHRDKDHASPLAPSVSIPGAVFAQPSAPPASQASGPPGGGAPGGPLGGALPGGALPGFGKGLRGGVLGCANAEALHFTPAERARCAEEFGAGAKESPQMDAIDASKRQELEHQAAQAAAAQKYRDSTQAGTESTPIPGQPRLGHSPGGD